MRTVRPYVLLLCLSPFSFAHFAEEEPDRPFRVGEFFGAPDWFRVDGELRLRWEGITGQFRSAARLDDSDNVLFQRTLLDMAADFETVAVGVEIIDARHYGGSRGSALNNNSVDTLDLLQAYGEVRLGPLGCGDHRLRVGRTTMDLGSRRLAARNRFRNTIEAFTGADWLWRADAASLRVFWTLPVGRRPDDIGSLVDNEIELDNEDLDRQFFGGFFEGQWCDGHRYEVYAFGLLENENARERELLTPGVRFYRPPQPSNLDYEYEGAIQFGTVKPTGTGSSLDHRAWFQHASLGYTFEGDLRPRLRLALDYASGDRRPGDGDNERFDTLFGQPREYGPTGLYTAVVRSNILSPDVRLFVTPRPDLRAMLAWRGIWLASKKDAWTTAGVRDPSGDSGRHVGQQLEGLVRWDVIPDSVRFECGGAYLFAGKLSRNAPGGQDTDTAYGYAELTFSF